MNITIVIYHGLAEPFTTRTARRLDFFNEMGVITITYFMFMYNDNIPDEDLKYVIGWAQVFVFAFLILVNAYGIVIKMCWDTYLLMKKRFRLFKRKYFRRQPEAPQPQVNV